MAKAMGMELYSSFRFMVEVIRDNDGEKFSRIGFTRIESQAANRVLLVRVATPDRSDRVFGTSGVARVILYKAGADHKADTALSLRYTAVEFLPIFLDAMTAGPALEGVVLTVPEFSWEKVDPAEYPSR